MTTIALFGPSRKVGHRTARLLNADSSYKTLFVEPSEGGQSRLADIGIRTTPADDAVRDADVIILAVPNILIGQIAHDVAPNLKPGAMVIGLNPAAPHGSKLSPCDDIACFITHPCHTQVYKEFTSAGEGT